MLSAPAVGDLLDDLQRERGGLGVIARVAPRGLVRPPRVVHRDDQEARVESHHDPNDVVGDAAGMEHRMVNELGGHESGVIEQGCPLERALDGPPREAWGPAIATQGHTYDW